jgi:hypothetical protein
MSHGIYHLEPNVTNLSQLAAVVMPAQAGLCGGVMSGPNVSIDVNGVISVAPPTPAQVHSDWNATSGVAQILNQPLLAKVATTGSYPDLTNKPTIPAAQVNSDWKAVSGVAQILNQPILATVATTGSYTDLLNKPTIPPPQVQSDWTAASGMGQILHQPPITWDGSNVMTFNAPATVMTGAVHMGIRTVTANATMTATDYTLIANAPALITITLPAAPAVGRIVNVKNIGGKGITVSGGALQIDGGATVTVGVAASLHVQFDGAQWRVI